MAKVSIITPLYNKAPYIAQTINSVLSQTFSNWEMLVVDNGSTDGGWEVAQQIKDPRLQFLQSPKQGPGAARNYGLTHAQGEWIQFLDADDLLEPDHLLQQLSVAQQNSPAEIIACCWQEFTENNPVVRTLKYPTGIGQTNQVLRDSAIAFAPWAVHAALVRRAVLTREFFWTEELDSFLSEDTAFWFCLLTKSSVAFSNNAGALYRKQTANCRDEYRNPVKWLEGIKAITDYNVKFLKAHGDKPSATQCEMLMRSFLSTASVARVQKNFATEREALAYAQKWLQECSRCGGINTFSLHLRKIFGLRLVEHLALISSNLKQLLKYKLQGI